MWTSRLPAAAAATALAPHIGLRKAFAATVSTTGHQAAIFTPSSLCISSSPSRYSPDRLQGVRRNSKPFNCPKSGSFLKVGNVSVSCTRISLDELEYEAPRTKTFRTVEASLRLDALASTGFKISRTKLVDLISKGDVQVNWNTALKNGTILREGDVVSVSDKGRLKIGEINTTKKGKYSVELIQYL